MSSNQPRFFFALYRKKYMDFDEYALDRYVATIKKLRREKRHILVPKPIKIKKNFRINLDTGWTARKPPKSTIIADLIRVFVNKLKVKCCLCGETFNRCLHFHHKNPKEKEIDISSCYNRKSIEKLIIELQKCVVVCFNCHIKIHCDGDMNTDSLPLISLTNEQIDYLRSLK